MEGSCIYGSPRGLPEGGDPYSDIYKTDSGEQSARRYRLLPQENIQKLPAQASAGGALEKEDVAIKKRFNILIDGVCEFHDQIRGKYHKDTFAFWGCEKAHSSMAGVIWKPSARPSRL
jgi:hypothetical protein